MTTPDPFVPDSDLMWEMAAAIAGRRDKVLVNDSSENTYAQQVAWPRQPLERPWAVLLRDRAQRLFSLPFDFDVSGGDPATKAGQLVHLLDCVEMPYIHAISGPTGGHHVFVLLADPLAGDLPSEIGQLVKGQVGGVDLSPLADRWNAAIRPPGSPHRRGGFSQLLSDESAVRYALDHRVDRKQLSYLLAALGTQENQVRRIVESSTEGYPAARLSGKTRDLLATGQKAHGDRSKSGILFSALLGLHNGGFSREKAIDVVLSSTFALRPVADAWATKHNTTAKESLRVMWSRVEKYAAEHPPVVDRTDAIARIQAISDAASKLTWPGRTGITDRMLYEAVVQVALRCGLLEFTASHRQLALLAGLSEKTVSRSLNRLGDRGLIRRQAGDFQEITHFALPVPQTPPIEILRGGVGSNGGVSGIDVRRFQHEAFRRGGLGHSALLVYSALDEKDSLAAKQLVRLTGRCNSTIYKALKRMLKLGMVVEAPEHRWLRAANVDLDRVAEIVGTAGATDRQRERHEREREAFESRHPQFVEWTDPETGERRLWDIASPGESGPPARAA